MPTAPKWVNDALEKIAPSMLRMVKVEEIFYLNPCIKKVRLRGDFSALHFAPGFVISFRVSPTELRHYTVSQFDASSRTMDFIAHIHGDAIGAQYINGLMPGNEKIKLAVLGSDKQYDSKVEKQIIFGDETSLSLMSSFLPYLQQNQHQYQFLLELDDENRDIPEKLRLENYRVYSKNDLFRDKDQIHTIPHLLENAWSDANIVLTGNVDSIQNFRKVLKENKHKGKIYVKGYWMEGKKGL
ncbi:oxidoreductase [Chryseobacterium luquanense]|nr:oxidoreductase [Chryseobacterium luquanense]